MNEYEEREKFRRMGCVRGPLKPQTIQCDFYAEFMRRRFPHADEDYALEWADRFATGREFQFGDKKSKEALLDIMVEGPGDGTARHLNEEILKGWYKKRFE